MTSTSAHALPLYRMIGFLAAVCFECFNTNDIPTLVLTTTVSFLIVALSFWCAYSGSQHSETTKAFFKTSWERGVKPIKTLNEKVRSVRWRKCEVAEKDIDNEGEKEGLESVNEKDAPECQV